MTTLTVAPYFPVAVQEMRRAVSTPQDTGQVVRRQVQSSVSRNSNRASLRQWQVTWGPITVAEKTSILSVFDAAMGRAFQITWTPPGLSAGAIPVRFMSDALDIRHIQGKLYSISAALEEVI